MPIFHNVGTSFLRRVLTPLCCAFALSACYEQDRTWRQELTLKVETPRGPASFSSVTQMECKLGYALDINGKKLECREAGEALVAQLGDRQLFVLLDGRKLGVDGGFSTLRQSGDGWGTFADRILASGDHEFDVPRARFPLFVSFADVSDPASVFLVDPDDLSDSFGSGYSDARLTIRVTEKPISFGAVEAVLGADFFRRRAVIHHEALDRGLDDPYFDSLTREMHRNHFIRDIPKASQ